MAQSADRKRDIIVRLIFIKSRNTLHRSDTLYISNRKHAYSIKLQIKLSQKRGAAGGKSCFTLSIHFRMQSHLLYDFTIEPFEPRQLNVPDLFVN